MRVVPATDARIAIRLWAMDVSANSATMRQLERRAAQPYVVDFVASMADVHLSEGIAVGSVLATEREVVPRALGGDLGCGMMATRLGFSCEPIERKALQRGVDLVGEAIPSGDRTHDPLGARAEAGAIRLSDHLYACSSSTRALVPGSMGTASSIVEGLGAYRDIVGVLWQQEDLVTKRVRLEPLAVFKG